MSLVVRANTHCLGSRVRRFEYLGTMSSNRLLTNALSARVLARPKISPSASSSSHTPWMARRSGHVELSTTEIYTQVSICKLKEIRSATHPSARLGRKGSGDEGPDPEREALLESLAAEADEEAEDED